MNYNNTGTAVEPSSQEDRKIDLVTCLAGTVLAIFFIFPQFPIQVRYFMPICALVLLLRLEVVRQKIFLFIAGYFTYVTVLGLSVVAFTGSDSVPDALYGIKSAGLCTVVLVFASKARVRDYGILATISLVGGAVGMVLDYKYGPIYAKMPFPILSDKDLLIRAGSEFTSDRFGGFTFEAGVAGGLSAIFIIICLAIIYLKSCDRRLKIDFIMLTFMVCAICCGLVTIALGKTKSSLFIIIFGALGATFAILFGGHKAGPWWAKTSVLVVLLAALVSIPVGYKIVQNTAMGAYIEKEIDNIYLLASRGFDKGEGMGLNTRIESAKKALYALPYRPTGGGYTSGEFYVKPILEKINATPEMEFFHNLGVWDGYKGAIFNIIGIGGIVGIGLLGYLIGGIVWGIRAERFPGGVTVGAMLAMGLLGLGVTVELLPFLEICLLFWCFVNIGLVTNEAGASLGQTHVYQMRRLFAGNIHQARTTGSVLIYNRK